MPKVDAAPEAANTGASAPLNFGKPDADQRVPMADILSRLDSADASVRDKATLQLLAQVYSLAEIEAELAKPELSPEQVARLAIAGYSAFCREPRGALGVQFAEGRNGVELSGVIENFPASKVLQAGDVIVEIGGHQIRGSDTWSAVGLVRPYIISYNVGEKAPITVMRDKRRVTLQVELGSFANLGNQFLDQSEYAGAWAIRLARTRPSMIKDVIVPAQPDGGWTPDGFSAIDLEYKHRADAQGGNVPSLVAGGVAGSRPGRADRPRAYGDVGDGVRQIIVQNNGLLIDNGIGQIGNRFGRDPALLAQLERQQRLMLLLVQQQQIAAALNNNALDANQRAQIRRMLDIVNEQIKDVKQQLNDRRP